MTYSYTINSSNSSSQHYIATCSPSKKPTHQTALQNGIAHNQHQIRRCEYRRLYDNYNNPCQALMHQASHYCDKDCILSSGVSHLTENGFVVDD